jgi:hypothetical protein
MTSGATIVNRRQGDAVMSQAGDHSQAVLVES